MVAFLYGVLDWGESKVLELNLGSFHSWMFFLFLFFLTFGEIAGGGGRELLFMH